MIYLIDDSNLRSLDAEYVFDEKYKEALSVITSFDQLNDVMDSLETSECILVHNTFNNSNIVREDMSEITDDGDNIPLVIFSGGEPVYSVNHINGNCINKLNKRLFYQRLKYFLDEYCANGIVNLRILAEGYDYIINDIESWALSIFNIIKGKSGMILSEDIELLNNNQELKNIINRCQPDIGLTYEKLIDIINSGSITYENIKFNINKIINSFNQYGKDIFIWK